MKSPFGRDDRMEKMFKAGAIYVLVSPESETQIDFWGYKDKTSAMKNAIEVSDIGLWVYVVETATNEVVAYFPGHH